MSNTFDITAVINETASEWVEDYGITPQQINHGECAAFAHEVCNSYSGSELLIKRTADEDVLGQSDASDHLTEPHHVWIFDGQYHYDAEAPDGVPTWRDLPFFERNGYGEDGTY